MTSVKFLFSLNKNLKKNKLYLILVFCIKQRMRIIFASTLHWIVFNHVLIEILNFNADIWKLALTHYTYSFCQLNLKFFGCTYISLQNYAKFGYKAFRGNTESFLLYFQNPISLFPCKMIDQNATSLANTTPIIIFVTIGL